MLDNVYLRQFKKNIMKKKPIFFLLLVISTTLFYSQNKSDNYYNWFDTMVGAENTGLYIGTEYQGKQRINKENYIFFNSPSFLPGSVTYDGETHYDLQLKYNVYDDQVLIKLKNKVGETVMQAIKDKISGFTIDGYSFEKLDGLTSSENEISGFHEILYTGVNFVVYKKHFKNRIQKLDRQLSYYEYKPIKSQYFIFHNGTYERVRAKKDFARFFPEHKASINGMDVKASRSDRDAQMLALSRHLNNLLSISNTSK